MSTVSPIVLRQKLSELGFVEPLSSGSAPLVANLVESIEAEKAKTARLEAICDQQASALYTADQVAPPLRKEIGRLIRENNALHMAMISLRETAEAHAENADSYSMSASRQVRDVTFLCSQLKKANAALEEENAGLREAATRSFEVNGVILPSGHEVRWNGRKERMEAHSPIPIEPPPADPEAEAEKPAAPPPSSDDTGEKLVRSAEAQLSALLNRVAANEDMIAKLEAALITQTQRASEKAAESERLGELLAAAMEQGAPAEARRVEQSGQLFAVRQLNGQVDFLNDRCAGLELQLEREQSMGRAARLDQEERTRYLDAISMLREEKQELLHELERAAGLAKALGLARPSALVPFAVGGA